MKFASIFFTASESIFDFYSKDTNNGRHLQACGWFCFAHSGLSLNLKF